MPGEHSMFEQETAGGLGSNASSEQETQHEEHMFRAAPMTLVQMYITQGIARDVVGMLGSLGCVHFQDLNEDVSQFNRLFVPELRRIDESARHLKQLEHSCADFVGYTETLDDDLSAEPLVSSSTVAEVMELVEADAEKLCSLVASFRELTNKREELSEERSILHKTGEFFGPSRARSRAVAAQREGDEAPLLDTYEDVETEFDIEEEDFMNDEAEAHAETDHARENNADPANNSRNKSVRFESPLPYFNQDISAGVIDRSKSSALERLCWRLTRGNLVMSRFPCESEEPKGTQVMDEFGNGPVAKDVFIIYTHGFEIGQRVLRICESSDARIVSVNPMTREDRLVVVNDQLGESFTVIEQTEGTLRVEQEIAAQKLPFWKVVLAKERAVNETSNSFSSDHGRQGLIGEGWVPSDRLFEVQDSVTHLSQNESQLAVVNAVKTRKTPPTFHTTNKVTAGFQAMVDVYGIARYGEVNPGLPTTVTFPFSFAVMFGDVGHGFILFLGAFSLVWNEMKIARQKNRDELFDMAYTGRYVSLLMGLFSIFTGFIYNDIFSRSMTIFSSGWEFPKGEDGATNTVASRVGHHVYPFGLDWMWHGAENNLRFTNSYKMKLSVSLGFIHMTYSSTFQYVNARHFQSWVDIWGNFVPSMSFMQSIFGYLSITIVYKWTVDWFGKQKTPPGLSDMLIKMFLSPGSIDPPSYKGQAGVQILSLLLALVCVPWSSLFKPMYLRRQMKNNGPVYEHLRLDEHTFAIDEDEFELGEPHEDASDFSINSHDGHSHTQFNEDVNSHNTSEEPSQVHRPQGSIEIADPHPSGHEAESFGDIMIHQVIHTIEFCSNCVSHTASYLRLWALSLAHSQLSIVLWNMTSQNAFGPTGFKGIVMVVCLFAMWFVITVLVLVCMEGTSAMLHALRLQWVEAMSKHFEGEGYAFQPLNSHAL